MRYAYESGIKGWLRHNARLLDFTKGTSGKLPMISATVIIDSET